MKLIARLIKYIFSFLKKDKVKEIEDEAKSKVDKVPDGKPMSDFLNKQLRDD